MVNKFGKKAKMIFLDGIKEASQLVSPTIGPYGSYYLIGQEPLTLTNNGYKLIQTLETNNPISQLGVNLLLSEAENLYNRFFDGTTSFILIACRMLDRSQSIIDSDIDINKLSQAIRTIQSQISSIVQLSSMPLTPDIVPLIATSAANDQEIGTLVSSAFQESDLGNYVIEEGEELSYYQNHRTSIGTGMISMQMINGQTGVRVIENPRVVLVNGRYDLAKLTEAANTLFVFNNLDNNEIYSINRHYVNCPGDFISINANNEDIALIRSLEEFRLINGYYQATFKQATISPTNTILETSNEGRSVLTFTIPQTYRRSLQIERLEAAIHGVINAASGVSAGEGIVYINLLNNLKARNVYEEAVLSILNSALDAPYTQILYNAYISRDNRNRPYDFNIGEFVEGNTFSVYTPTNLTIAIVNQAMNLLNDYLYIRGFIT